MPGLVIILDCGQHSPVQPPIDVVARPMWHEDFYQMDICNGSSRPFIACRVHINVPGAEPQPIQNEDGTVVAMVDGELRLSDQVRGKLESRGHRIKSRDSAELFVHLYEEYGESFVDEIEGRFLALIYDSKTRTTLIFNDRFGLYRAFYAVCDGTYVIASEMKSLLKYDRRLGRLNADALGQYFLYDGVLDEETLFRGIRRLPPAAIWTYRAGEVSRKQYYDLSKLDVRTDLDERAFAEQGARLFRDAVLADAARSDAGVSITGGWDSRAVVAVMSEAGYTAPCYTWCNPLHESLDVQLARRVVKSIGQQLNVFTLGEEFFDNFEDYARRTTYVSDGCADIFRSHELYFNRASRRVAPVRITGAYGSEIACRNPYFLRPHKVDSRVFSDRFRSDCGDLAGHARSFETAESFLNGLRWLFPSGNYSIERSLVEVRWPFVNRRLVELFFSAPQDYVAKSRIQKYVVTKCAGRLASLPSDKGAYIQSDNRMQNLGLRLWAGLIKLASTLDNAYVHINVPHKFTRMDPFMRYTGVEKVVMGRRNLVAYRIWMKRNLRRFFESILLDERTLSRGYCDAQFIRQMAKEHFTDRANYTREIGKIASLEMFHRVFID